MQTDRSDTKPTLECAPETGRRLANGIPWVLAVSLVVGLAGAGLLRDLREPWIGMHDWNGAFFSQLARNLLRYPFNMHHGMPVIAVGDAPPAGGEWSFYSTHPPGLVWLIAAAFRVFGDSEIVARMVPIVASLASVFLLIRLSTRRLGPLGGLLTGSIYAVLPMAAYFGRMPDHEAPELAFMLAAIAAWGSIVGAGAAATARRWRWMGLFVAIFGAVWIDWPGAVFAAVLSGHAVWRWRRGTLAGRAALVVVAFSMAAVGSMLAYLVICGLDGRAGDLVSIFLSRTSAASDAIGPHDQTGGGIFGYIMDNLTWPIALWAVAGAVIHAASRFGSRLARMDGMTEGLSRATESGRDAGCPLWIVTIVGLIWIAVLPRQFVRHNYWMFYLGPAISLYASRFVLRLSTGSMGARRGAVALMFVLFGAGLVGTDAFFSRVAFPPDLVEALRTIHEERGGRRLLLHRNPIRIEQRGDYRMRDIVPPQWAYYLDAPFDVLSDLTKLPTAATSHAAFVISVEDAIQLGDRMQAVHKLARFRQLGPLLVFDLSPDAGN